VLTELILALVSERAGTSIKFLTRGTHYAVGKGCIYVPHSSSNSCWRDPLLHHSRCRSNDVIIVVIAVHTPLVEPSNLAQI
jgi:hypothetical protein